MDSILMSIKPKHVWNICRGIKTIEVRKSIPKNGAPFKVHIYCTKSDKKCQTVHGYMIFNSDELYRHPTIGIRCGSSIELVCGNDYTKDNFLNGKVVGEFVCDYVEKFSYDLFDDVDIDDDTLLETSLERDEINTYANGKILYGLHISELKIYDKPKELSDFIVPSKSGCVNEGKCRDCIYFDKGNGFNVEDDCKAPFCTDEYKPLRRPPQSWCYVRELKGESNE